MLIVNRASLPPATDALERAGFDRIHRIAWVGGMQMGGDPRHFDRPKPPRRAYVLVARMPRARVSAQRVIRTRPVLPGEQYWPTEKPVYLGAALARIAGVRRGDVVVDPHCGSGALLIGPMRLGADVVGIDSSARAIAIARDRLATAA